MAADPITPITTERLIIRPFIASDFDAIHAVLNSAFGEVPLAERRRWLQWSILNEATLAWMYQPPYGDLAVVRRDTHELIGSVGLVPAYGPFERLPSFQQRLATPNTTHFTTEMGLFWGIHASHRRQGYAAEAALALVDTAFQRLNLQRIVATTDFDNEASVGVMRKIGMTIERNPDADPPWFQVVGVKFNC
ncbi:GNAT family N-acetyltransferase [bacterium]|nr:GNAT family N-acetyltransferase [bacterium]